MSVLSDEVSANVIAAESQSSDTIKCESNFPRRESLEPFVYANPVAAASTTESLGIGCKPTIPT